MSKILRLFMVLAVVAIFTAPQYADAAAAVKNSTDWGTTALTITHADLGVTGGGTDTFTSSNGVQVGYTTDASGNYFAVVAQHQKGDKRFGMHSNGGAMFVDSTLTSMGTWDGDLPAAPTDDPLVPTFPVATWSKL